jgi:hypothetical protein
MLQDKSRSTKDEWKYFYFEISLVDGSYLKHLETDVPIGDKNIGYTQIFGSFNGFAYYYNPEKRSLEIMDIVAKKILFSHPYTIFDYLYQLNCDNGRYIAMMDKSDIFCFDTQTGKLWTQTNAILLTNGSCDGKWIIADCGYENGKYWVKLAHAQHENRKISIPDVKSSIITESDCVLEVTYSVDKNPKIIRHELDGTVNTIECPKINLTFLFNGKWHFLTASDGKATVYITEATSLKSVYTQDIESNILFARFENDELMFTSSKTRLDIVNLKTGLRQYFDIENNVSWPEFAGRRHVIFRKTGKIASFILDRVTGKIESYEKYSFLGCEGDTLYFSSEKELLKFSDGKFETIKKGSSVRGEILQNGLFVGCYELYDTKGDFIQKLSINKNYNASFGAYLGKVEMSTDWMRFDLGRDETFESNSVRFETCPTFSLKRGDKGLKLENLSKTEISGTIWIADLSENENIVRMKSDTFKCKGEESIHVCKTAITGHCVVFIESNALMDTSESTLENVRPGYQMPRFEGNPVISAKKKAVVVTEWGN